MNSIQFNELKFESPISKDYLENGKNNKNSCNSLTTTEQNDKVYQNNMSITKFKYSNSDYNSSLKNNNEKNNIPLLDWELSPFNEKKLNNNSEENSPISSLCNYYLQSDNNFVKGNKKNSNLKTDNNNNDCKKNISPDLCSPIKKEKIKNKCLEKSKSQFNNIIKTKINELNNILYDKIKDKNFSFRKFTIGNDNTIYNNSTNKFLNLKYKQNNSNDIKNKIHFDMNNNQEKNSFYNLIPKIINEKKKKINLIPHCKITNKFNNNITNYNFKPKTIDRKSNYSFESLIQKNNYNKPNNFNKTKLIFSKLDRNQLKEDKNNTKLNSKIKEYSNNSFNNKNISFHSKNSSSNIYKIINSSPNNSNYPPQNMKTIPNDSIIKSPNKKLSFQSDKPLSKIKNYYYTKSKKIINSLYNNSTNNTSNYFSYLTTNFSNKNNKTDNTYENSPSNFRLNNENKLKKIYSYNNEMNNEINEKEKIQAKKIDEVLIKIKSYRSNQRNKKRNLFLLKYN